MLRRKKLTKLVHEIPDEELEPVLRYVRVLHAFMTAPEDDEPLTDEDIAAIGGGKAEIARGEVISWEQVKRELAALPRWRGD
jgi:hypothetical protein